MDDKTTSFNNCKKRIVGILFALLMSSFAIPFLTFSLKNVKTIISECKTIYYCLDYNFINRQTDEGFETRTEHLKTSFNSFANDLLSQCTFYDSCKCYMTDVHGLFVKTMDLYVPVPIYKDIKAVKMNNNQLTFYGNEDVDIENYARSLINFKKYLDKQGAEFVYVQAPHKNYKYQPAVPSCIGDCSNQIFDRLILAVENEISVIDMREYFKSSPEKHYNLFYPGDSHWRPEYAFITVQQIMNRLHDTCSCIIDQRVNNLDNYKLVTTDQKRNDMSKPLGNLYFNSEKEYEQFLVPKFDTHLTVTYDSEECQGSYNPQLMYKTRTRMNIKNPDAINKKRIMFLGDSFSPPVMSYLTLNFTDTEYHALLFYDGNIFDDIEKYKPDIVVLLFTARIVESIGVGPEEIAPSTKRYFEILTPPTENLDK